ncbi:hypothetical protein D3227_39155 [Mesorhizobium waimense]|uniref:HEPN domain-containing protein n=1 Tax=Mesorhizobium waimense TaxID=1300307 RepID=A0A3A5JSM9_9HYPH|nr:hypothetical protein [Mesorhizobium waimense]RJT23003.1 hypothetical protein D3227_39155 [Mesorhizobium waimense]
MGDKAAKKPKVVHGAGVTPYGMYLMAQNYRATADALENVVVLPHVTDHPRHFLYYQALEHFLRTFLHLKGQKLKKIQRLGHDWGKMLDRCQFYDLQLPAQAEKFIRSSALDNALVRVRYEIVVKTKGRKARSTLPLEKAIYALELAVGQEPSRLAFASQLPCTEDRLRPRYSLLTI